MEEAIRLENKKDLVFTDEDEQDEFEDLLESLEEGGDWNTEDRRFAKLGKVRLIHKREKTFDVKNGNIISILRFMDEKDIHETVEEIITNPEEYKDVPLTAMLPFLEEEDCDALFKRFVIEGERYDGVDLSPFGPFVSAKCLEKLVDAYIEGKKPNIDFGGLYAFMESKDIKRLFDFYVKRRRADSGGIED
ncbi:MAG: hypothetical protein SPL80_06850 [Bacilli bacterium]|nr:hypothetical protein [Bacilli bacterium]